MSSGCNTPIGYDTFNASHYHADGASTPPALPITNPTFLASELKSKLASINAQQLKCDLLEAKPVGWILRAKAGELPDPMKVAPGLPPPPGLVPYPQWHQALVAPGLAPPQPHPLLRPAPGLSPPSHELSEVTSGIPPPPQPHSVLRPAPGLTEPNRELSEVISVGTVGHPMNCAPACKHVKRKGGCREGVNCPQCHACFWSRHPNPGAPKNVPGTGADPIGEASTTENPVMSEGTRGHPHSCAPACKYFRRKQGCRDGAACTQCHACSWHRRVVQNVGEEKAPASQGGLRVDGLQQSSGVPMPSQDFPFTSLGSLDTPAFFADAVHNGYIQAVGLTTFSL